MMGHAINPGELVGTLDSMNPFCETSLVFWFVYFTPLPHLLAVWQTSLETTSNTVQIRASPSRNAWTFLAGSLEPAAGLRVTP